MRIITDFHLHSKWSRACSKNLTLPNIARACEIKGIGFVGTSDAFHPAWREDIGKLLEDVGEGAFSLKDSSSPTRFLLSTEISCIYKRADKVRRVHHLILFPNLAALDRLTKALNDRGCNLKSDGRPIVGIDSEELLKMTLEADPRCLFIPAHAWTPWFAIFGSQSGFNAIEECFGEEGAKNIYAIETGLSSDPAMNWRLSALDRVFLVSNSDAHSPENLGREANVFEMERPSFDELRRIFVEHDASKFIETIEFFPEEGKYHTDGHRACDFWCEPEETKKRNGICPKCGKPLTIGVLHRISDLADRDPHPPRPERSVPFRSIVPLAEILSSVVGVSPKSKRVATEVKRFHDAKVSEFAVLLDLPEAELASISSPEIVAAIMAVRRGDVDLTLGYDGEYGVIRPRTSFQKAVQSPLF
ncbi:MAG: endonuclease Q family protein [Patescibacteria group bacterium]|jgi:uncharacterized protein (TIGR00375 family)